MKTTLLKFSFIAFLSLFFMTNNSLAKENPTKKKTKSETNHSKIEKKTNKKSNSKKIKKLTFKEKFRIIKQFRKEKRKARKLGIKADDRMILLYVLAVLLPPVAVGIYTDWDAKLTLIDLLLTIIFWIPGVVFAFFVLLS